MNLTENEIAVLMAIYANNFHGDPDGPIWADCINDSALPSGLEGKALAAVCSNLAQKGLITTEGTGRDSTITLTPAGLERGRAEVNRACAT